jgi:hypothetical protein
VKKRRGAVPRKVFDPGESVLVLIEQGRGIGHGSVRFVPLLSAIKNNSCIVSIPRSMPLATNVLPRRAAAYAAAWMVVLLAGCSSKDLPSELDTVRSWTATTLLAADRRAAGATNRAVTIQLVDRATKARGQAAQELAQLARADSARVVARAALDSLDQGIALLRSAAR